MIGQLGLWAWLPFFIFASFGFSPTQATQVRALWVVRHDLTSPERVAQVVDRAREAGINTLFVQVRGRGDAYYLSDSVPSGEAIEPGFDPLAACVELAHQASIELHAWVNVYLTWYPNRTAADDHLLSKHPEWFMISDDGVDLGQPDVGVDLVKRGVEGRYLSPSNPAVTRHLLRVIEELVDRYPLDGIHLDYVRYPNEHYDFSPIAQAEFWTDTEEEVPDSNSDGVSQDVWNRWRSGRVTDFVRKTKQIIENHLPDARLSAAVKPELSLAYKRYGQDWIHWVNRRYIDFAVPMFYTGSSETILSRMKTVRKYVQRGRVYAGLGAWNQDPKDTFEQIDLVDKAHLDGFSLFSYTTLLSSPELQKGMQQRFGTP
jgi:uncharacterized lipoprotein YddW (UPF0748 family)